MRKLEEKTRKRVKRKLSIRKKIGGTPDKPRLSVYKSNKHTYIQAIDDVSGTTIASASNLEKDQRSAKNVVSEMEKLGILIGQRLIAKKIQTVVFDRNGYKYHGKVKAVADGARKAGLRF
jgi:large subunit ribosomal protein L18